MTNKWPTEMLINTYDDDRRQVDTRVRMIVQILLNTFFIH